MGRRLDEALRIKPLIQKGAQSLSDAEALQIKAIYPKWDGAAAYEVEDKVLYRDVLYRCIQAHTAQADWTPAVAASLWTVIDEAHAGTIEAPIPYSGNMALEHGKYYAQDDITYLCTRDTGIAVHSALKDLVGHYVEVSNDGI